MTTLDDETLERALFAHRAAADRPPGALDIDDVLARVDLGRRRTRVFDVARVVTLANAFAAAAACLAMVRAVPSEPTLSQAYPEGDDSANVAVLPDASLLTCGVNGAKPSDRAVCAPAPAMTSMQLGRRPREVASSTVVITSWRPESLSCNTPLKGDHGEVTCEAVGP